MVRLLAMGQLPEGWERATFQGELDTGLLLPKLRWEWERCVRPSVQQAVLWSLWSVLGRWWALGQPHGPRPLGIIVSGVCCS